MFCKHCGGKIEDKAAFCIHCGKAVSPEQDPTSLTGKSRKGMGILFSLILSFIGLLIGVWLFNEDAFETKTFVKGWLIGFLISSILGIIIGLVYCCSIFA